MREAQRLAIQQDFGASRWGHLQTAAHHQAVSARQLPDPMVRFGVMNLPTDTFDLDQEPMTQLQFGVRQQFPSGNVREYRKQEQLERAGVHEARGEERLRKVRKLTANAWLDRWFAEQTVQILETQKKSYQRLQQVIRAMLGSGKSTQADLLAMQLQVEQQSDRIAKSRGALDVTATTLARWIGLDATRALPHELPADSGWAFNDGESPDTQQQQLLDHPSYRIAQAEIRTQDARVKQAREAYKPAWAIDLGYAMRDGYAPNGDRRPDFASAMVGVSVPLFPAQRQDAMHAARTAEKLAAIDHQRELLLELKRQSRAEFSRLGTLEQRLDSYTKKIIPRAVAHARAQLNAYRSASGSIHDVLRSEIAIQNARLKELELRIQRRKVLANLEYLHGAPQMAMASKEANDE